MLANTHRQELVVEQFRQQGVHDGLKRYARHTNCVRRASLPSQNSLVEVCVEVDRLTNSF